MSSVCQAQNVWYVDPGGNDSNPGFPTWDDAFQTLQRALDEAEGTGGSDLIKVSQGVYRPEEVAPPGARRRS